MALSFQPQYVVGTSKERQILQRGRRSSALPKSMISPRPIRHPAQAFPCRGISGLAWAHSFKVGSKKARSSHSYIRMSCQFAPRRRTMFEMNGTTTGRGLGQLVLRWLEEGRWSMLVQHPFKRPMTWNISINAALDSSSTSADASSSSEAYVGIERTYGGCCDDFRPWYRPSIHNIRLCLST